MDCLKYKCEQYLGNMLTIATVIEVLLIADLYGSPELKSRCINFITDRPEAIMGSEHWDKIKDRPDIALQLFRNQSAKRLGCPS